MKTTIKLLATMLFMFITPIIHHFYVLFLGTEYGAIIAVILCNISVFLVFYAVASSYDDFLK